MNLSDLTFFLIIGLSVVIFIIVRVIKEKRLEEYLLKYGIELEAEAKVIGGDRLSGYLIEVNFQHNGQTIKKRLNVDRGSTFGHNSFPANGYIRKFPVLVDPFHPKRFLFNIRKFHLTKTSDDSVQNFLKRCKAENPDFEERN